MMRRVCVLFALLTGVAFGEETQVAAPPAEKTEKTFKVEGPGEALRVTLEDLNLRNSLQVKELPVDIDQRLPEWLKKLDGKAVRISGEMFPTDRETGLKGFLMIRGGLEYAMHFGRRLHPDEKLVVRMRSGVTTDYISGRKFDVVGKFSIKSRVRDGELFLLYVIEDAVVIDP
jgi:hypothetical protein